MDKFDDPLEGMTYDLIANEVYCRNYEGEIAPSWTESEKRELQKEGKIRRKHIIDETAKIQKSQFASCWFLSKKESFAMWNLYSNRDGVAIRYNPNELTNLIKVIAESYVHHDFNHFISGKVDYVDIWPFDLSKKFENKHKFTALKKDTSYSHENEYRFIVATPNTVIGKYESFELPMGDFLNDDFNIFANPYMEHWKFENLLEILKSYKLDHKLTKSNLFVKDQQDG
ncbi:DUF2971 domain-containing protein [Mangrovibacterium lignilyticum]|uniref:DUF2971 domain-containing protein n=1 Tax=Mangrovibacterium lignilyticum TaxID=2668052 RepID=UPI0013D88803|nr:DUF2971 domain-containing protein [Mangrovibacterium lignilyticum]